MRRNSLAEFSPLTSIPDESRECSKTNTPASGRIVIASDPRSQNQRIRSQIETLESMLLMSASATDIEKSVEIEADAETIDTPAEFSVAMKFTAAMESEISVPEVSNAASNDPMTTDNMHKTDPMTKETALTEESTDDSATADFIIEDDRET
jgi:hypothetical protein